MTSVITRVREQWRETVRRWEQQAEENDKAAEWKNVTRASAESARYAGLRGELLHSIQQRHLKKLIPESLPTIGPAMLALLRRVGVRTRGDLRLRSFEDLQAMHGIGPGRAALLLEWAKEDADLSPVLAFDQRRYAAHPGISPVRPKLLRLRRANTAAAASVSFGLAAFFFDAIHVLVNLTVGALFIVVGGLLATPWWRARMLGVWARLSFILLSGFIALLALVAIDELLRA